jgi:phosphosulfolactate synthase (CoM biosynthesis protein A)
MADSVLQREINGLVGDLNMNKIAIETVQNDMKAQLVGKMGEDINAVLSGKRTVSATKYERRKFKIKSWFKRFLRMF